MSGRITVAEAGKLGGHAAAKKMTKEQRVDRAMKAVKAREEKRLQNKQK